MAGRGRGRARYQPYGRGGGAADYASDYHDNTWYYQQYAARSAAAAGAYAAPTGYAKRTLLDSTSGDDIEYGGYGAYRVPGGGATTYDYADTDSGLHIGSHTSSNDPESVNARVFVGNLNTKVVTKEEVSTMFTRFGTINAISMHAGYAFVQFATEAEARNAVSFTDGSVLANQKLDVNLVNEPKQGRGANKKQRGGRGFSTQGFGTAQNFKRPAAPAASREYTKPISVTASTPNANGQCVTNFITYDGYPDTYTCGHCQTKFQDWDEFAAHRRVPCAFVKAEAPVTGDAGRAEGEPDHFMCFICREQFVRAWNLIEHVAAMHNMGINKVE